MDKRHEITVCMGSACFARGNEENLKYIEDFVGKNNLNAIIELSGSRCEGNCADGPNVVINGFKHNKVSENKLKEILEEMKNG